MRKDISIKLPDSWKDIKLKTYLQLQKDLDTHKDDPMAQLHFTMYHLCGIDVSLINSMTKESHEKIKQTLDALILNQQLPLQRIIQLDGIEYGFEPNLSKMAYGAYVDITANDTIAIDDKWAKVMSILYRPITQKSKDTYSILPYKGEIDEELFLEVGMDVHFGAWFFFINLQMDLVSSILSYTKGNLPPNIKSILQRSGKAIHQSMTLQEETYKKWMQSRFYH